MQSGYGEPEPTRRTFTRDELSTEAREFLLDRYGPLEELTLDDQDRWHTRYGLLLDFISEIAP